jgi:K(+)-stimulated pyrophosphate-energized sodium pump
MNLVALLIAPSVVKYSVGTDANAGIRTLVAVVATGVIVGAVYNSKRKSIAVGADSAAEVRG